MSGSMVARRPTRSPFVAIVRYTLRSCLPPKRWAAVLMACAGALLFGAARPRPRRADRRAAFANVAAEGIFSLMMPIAALVIGDAVLGAEVRGGTFHFTWLSPVPTLADRPRAVDRRRDRRPRHHHAGDRARRRRGGLHRRAPGRRRSPPRSGACPYIAVFIAIGCLTKRTAVWSLAFVFLIERLLGAALDRASPSSRRCGSRGRSSSGCSTIRPSAWCATASPTAPAAIVRLAIVTVVALVVASWRMNHLRLSGPAD